MVLAQHVMRELPARVWHNLSEIVNMEPLGFLICIFVVVVLCPLFLVDSVAAATLTPVPPSLGSSQQAPSTPGPPDLPREALRVREPRRPCPPTPTLCQASGPSSRPAVIPATDTACPPCRRGQMACRSRRASL